MILKPTECSANTSLWKKLRKYAFECVFVHFATGTFLFESLIQHSNFTFGKLGDQSEFVQTSWFASRMNAHCGVFNFFFLFCIVKQKLQSEREARDERNTSHSPRTAPLNMVICDCELRTNQIEHRICGRYLPDRFDVRLARHERTNRSGKVTIYKFF